MLLARRAAGRLSRPAHGLARRFSSRAPSASLDMLVVEAYDKTGRERLDSVGCRKASDIFASLLHRMCPADHHLNLTFIQPADSVQQVAEVGELSRFDGVVWTGSSLTIHDDVPEVTRQLELARRCFEAGVPQYGSCWGLQVSAMAVGIPCVPNPKGREHGIARGISLTNKGLQHPMFDGCIRRFDGCSAHTDHVASSWATNPVYPPGVEAQILATNAFTPWPHQRHLHTRCRARRALRRARARRHRLHEPLRLPRPVPAVDGAQALGQGRVPFEPRLQCLHAPQGHPL